MLTLSLGLAAGRAAAFDAPAVEGPAVASASEFVPFGTGQAESVRFSPAVLAQLLSRLPGGRLRVEGWPVSPGQRRDVVLERVEIYAPDARVFVVGPGGAVETERSRWAFFLGGGADDESVRLAAWIDPATGRVGGSMVTWQGDATLRSGPRGSTLVVPASADPGARLCGDDGAPAVVAPASPGDDWARLLAGNVISTLHGATLAVDTDNEFMLQKFGNNTTAATNYIASLVAAMNVMYERDLLVRLLVGTTFLRPSTTPDPYAQTNAAGTPPTSAQLNEVATFWNGACGATCTSVNRALVMLLSGKQLQAGTAAGIANIGASSPRQAMGVLCSAASGFSFIEPVNSGGSLSSIDAPVAGHEIGHNFGSLHTHCYQSSPGVYLDGCVTQSGCFNATPFCPAPATYNGVANVTGTVMSYCNPAFISGCSTTSVFHPYVVSNVLEPNVQAAVGTCILPIGGSPTVSSILPTAGVTTGGTPFAITGTGFQNGATVTFDGLPATGVIVVGSTSITGITPAHALGAVDVVVINPVAGNGLRGRLNEGYTYSQTSITSVTPAGSPLAGGTAITVKGANFQPGVVLTVGGVGAPPSSVVRVDSTTITAVTPARAAGVQSISVTNLDATGASLSNGLFYADNSAATGFYTLTPCRVLDTRNAAGPLGGPALAANGQRVFTLTGVCGIPSSAIAVSLNVTVTNAASTGAVVAFPGNAFPLGTSSLSYRAGVTRANNLVIELATNGVGSVGFANVAAGTVHLIVDVNGYFQ